MSETLSLRKLLVATTVLLAALGLVAPSPAQEATGSEPSQEKTTIEESVEDAAAERAVVEHRRVPVPSLTTDENHPFTIEIPLTWRARRDLGAPGVFLGPPSGDPNSHPEMLLVRESDVALDAPDMVLANLRSHDEAAEWSLREAEVRDFGGVRGLWIVREMPPVGFHGRRVSFAVKLPMGDGSLDVAATVPIEDYDALAPRVEQMLQSLRPAEAEEEAEPAPPELQG